MFAWLWSLCVNADNRSVVWPEQIDVLVEQGSFSQAVSLAEACLKEAEKQMGANDPQTLRVAVRSGEVLFLAGYPEKARRRLRETQKAQEGLLGKKHPDLAETLMRFAPLYQDVGSYETAESLWLRAKHILNRQGEPGGYDCDLALLNLYSEQGRLPEAESLFGRLGVDASDLKRQLLLLEYKAGFLVIAGRFEDALAMSGQAGRLAKRRFGPNHYQSQMSAWRHGVIQLRSGRAQNAWKTLRSVRHFFNKTLRARHPLRAELHRDLARTAWVLGDVAAVRSNLEMALQIYLKAGWINQVRVAECRLLKARLLIRTGSFGDAESLLHQVRVYFETQKAPAPGLADVHENFAELFRRSNRHVEAVIHEQICLELRKSLLGETHSLVLKSQVRLLSAGEGEGEGANLETLTQISAALMERHGSAHPDVMWVQARLGVMHLRSEAYQTALKILLGVSDSLRFGNVSDDFAAQVHTDLAAAAVAMGRTQLCNTHVLKALVLDQQLLETGFQNQDRSSRANLIGALASRRDRLHSVLTHGGHIDQKTMATLYRLQVGRKGLALERRLHEQSVLVDHAEAGRVQEELERVVVNLSKLVYTDDPTHSHARREQVDRLLSRQRNLEAQLSAYAPDPPFVSAQIVTQVQRALPRDAVLLDYFSFDKTLPAGTSLGRRFGVFVVTTEQVHWLELGAADSIQDQVQQFGRAIGQRHLGKDQFTQLGQVIRDRLLTPIESLISNSHTLFISPDGILAQLPFHTLPDRNGFLIQSYRCRYLSSGRDLIPDRIRSFHEGNMVVVADPDYGQSDGGGGQWSSLKDSREEALRIGAVFNWDKVSLIQGTDANKEAMGRIRSPRLLHFAVHGFYFRETGRDTAVRRKGSAAPHWFRDLEVGPAIVRDQFRSGLVLAGANSDAAGRGRRGILSALEVAGMALAGTELVVLSACETHVGEPRPGEGIYGLERAFRIAGARNVMLSLWKIPAEKERLGLIPGFYHHLHAGLDPHDALHAAMLEQIEQLKQRDGFAAPYWWGGFILAGKVLR